ncbi:MAG: GFA family protein [Roseibium sp.]
MTKKYSGKCLCGAFSYVAYGKPVIVAQCHCEECRRLSGTGHTVGAMFSSDEVILDGALTEFEYISENGSRVTKAFCTTCGSPIYGRNTRLPDHITLTLGTMDDANELSVEVVIFERHKQLWDQLGEDVISFLTQPDWTPEG